jgi:hypothetical protein
VLGLLGPIEYLKLREKCNHRQKKPFTNPTSPAQDCYEKIENPCEFRTLSGFDAREDKKLGRELLLENPERV